jgi:cytochrome c oxidase assembly protein subunit 11
MVIHPGAQATAFYEITNQTETPMVGIAVYNVTPDKAGAYFNKIECFCFDEQRIPAGVPMTLPVQFFIDPDILKDHPDIQTITLSYTFYEIKDFKSP